MPSRLQQDVRRSTWITTLAGTVCAALILAAFANLYAQKVDTPRFVADSSTRTFNDSLHWLNISRRLDDIGRDVRHMDSLLSARQRK